MASTFKQRFQEILAVSKIQKEIFTLIPSVSQRVSLLKRFKTISENVECPHNESHILAFVKDLLSLPEDLEGDIVEAGAFKGGSTSKISIIAERLERKLLVFDSFEGLPENAEKHEKSILGHSIEGWFNGKEFCGSLDEVKSNITKYGEIGVCEFYKGWFDDTMPGFSRKLCAVYLDVDLASSTKTCIKYLYPQIVPGGILYSQDGDFPLVIDVFNDNNFWESEVGCKKPKIEGLGKSKILKIVKL